MSAKSDILQQVRAAVKNSSTGPIPEPVREYRQSTEFEPGSPEVIAEMVDALEDYNAVVKVVEEAGIEDAIDQFLADLQAKAVVVPSDLKDSWKQAAGRGGRKVSQDDVKNPMSHDQLDQMDAVLTSSRVGISLSGTICLDAEDGNGRRAITLIPDAHVCVIYAKDIYPTVPQAVAVLDEHCARPQTWFAGPSATSDIELIRVDGVHGPRHLRVVIVK